MRNSKSLLGNGENKICICQISSNFISMVLNGYKIINKKTVLYESDRL